MFLLTSDLRPLTSAFLLRASSRRGGVAGRGERYLDAPVALAARWRRVGGDGVCRPHAVGLYARAVNARRDEATGEGLGSVLRELLQRRLVAARVGERLDAYAQVRVVGEERRERVNRRRDGLRRQFRRARARPERVRQDENNPLPRLAHGAEARERRLQVVERFALLSGAPLRFDASLFGLSLALDVRELELCVVAFGADCLKLVAQSRVLGPQFAQLLVRVGRVALCQLARRLLAVQALAQILNLLRRLRCRFLCLAHGAVARSYLLAPLARGGVNLRVLFGLRAEADGAARERIAFGLRLVQTPGVLGLFELSLRVLKFLRRVALGPHVAREVDGLTRAEQRRWRAHELSVGEVWDARVAEVV